MFRKAFIALFVLLLSTGNAGLSQLGKLSMTLMSSWDNRYTNSLAKTCPLGDAEEKSEKDGTSSESAEDDEYVSGKWASVRVSSHAGVLQWDGTHAFKRIDREILVPPPRV